MKEENTKIFFQVISHVKIQFLTDKNIRLSSRILGQEHSTSIQANLLAWTGTNCMEDRLNNTCLINTRLGEKNEVIIEGKVGNSRESSINLDRPPTIIHHDLFNKMK